MTGRTRESHVSELVNIKIVAASPETPIPVQGHHPRPDSTPKCLMKSNKLKRFIHKAACPGPQQQQQLPYCQIFLPSPYIYIYLSTPAAISSRLRHNLHYVLQIIGLSSECKILRITTSVKGTASPFLPPPTVVTLHCPLSPRSSPEM